MRGVIWVGGRNSHWIEILYLICEDWWWNGLLNKLKWISICPVLVDGSGILGCLANENGRECNQNNMEQKKMEPKMKHGDGETWGRFCCFV